MSLKHPGIKIAFLVIAVLGAYLFLAHAYFFWRLGRAGLPLPVPRTAAIKAENNMALKPLIYAALGDSLTAGAGLQRYEETYPYLLAEKISAGRGEIALSGFSYPGAKTADLIKDLLGPAIAQNPDIVTLLIGVNDVHGNVSGREFRNNYRQILKRLTGETRAEIYAINIPFIGSDSLLLPPYDYYYKKKTIEFNNIIKTLAQNSGVKYIDLASPTAALFSKDGAHYSADSFHPSAEGYRLWADIIYADINK
jgi:lysophospholipase L1-like esterase